MNKQNIQQHKLKLIVILLTSLLLICGCFIFPFYYETTTLWYKLGYDKVTLRIGQICGLLAFVFLCFQIILATRTHSLEQLLGLGKRIRLHRLNGLIIAVLVLIHMLLILVPEGITNLPFGKKYWPEMIGAFLFCIIIFTVITSQFRQKLRISFKQWNLLHKPLGYFIVAGSATHIYFVSDAFNQIIPQLLLLTLVVGVTCWVAYIKLIQHKNSSKS